MPYNLSIIIKVAFLVHDLNSIEVSICEVNQSQIESNLAD